MDLQVLVSTMYQKDFSLLQKMNIKSDAIIVNQCNQNKWDEFKYLNYNIKFLSLKERGVGLSRNNALMRASSSICLFADDDVRYLDEYRDIVLEEFKQHPSADVIVFNVPSTNNDPKQKDYIAKKYKKLNILNCFRHGTFRIAIKLDSVRIKNIYFSLLFGGGAKYSAGEDSLFLSDCIRKKLEVYESPKVIGFVSHETSTWFNGYTDKYFIDKGAFFACFSKYMPFLWCLQFAIRRRNLYINDKSFLDVCRLMKQGIKLVKRGRVDERK